MVSPDTIVPNPNNPQSFNRYSYVQNNPLRLVDPSGHSCQDALDGYPGESYDCLDEALLLEGEWPFHSNEDLASLIGTEFEGADTEDLGLAMYYIFNGSDVSWMSDEEAVEIALEIIADVRGLELSDVRKQYVIYYELTIQAGIFGRQNGKSSVEGTERKAWWGSTEQLRFGKVVGDAFGIDAVFGALLSPTGGRIGPGDSGFLYWSLKNSGAISYHGQVHDAAGYLYNYHNTGPGYTYAKPNAPASQRNNAIMGQFSRIDLWTALLVDEGK